MATYTQSEHITLLFFHGNNGYEKRPVLVVYVHCLSCLGTWYPKKNIGTLWELIHLWLRPSIRLPSFTTVVHLVHHSTSENVTQVSCNALLKYIIVLSPDHGPGLRILYSDGATGWTFLSSSPAIWKRFLSYRKCPDQLRAHRDSYSVGARIVYRQRSIRSIKLNAYLHIILRLRMNGPILLFPLHAFIVWTEKTLVFPFSAVTWLCTQCPS